MHLQWAISTPIGHPRATPSRVHSDVSDEVHLQCPVVYCVDDPFPRLSTCIQKSQASAAASMDMDLARMVDVFILNHLQSHLRRNSSTRDITLLTWSNALSTSVTQWVSFPNRRPTTCCRLLSKKVVFTVIYGSFPSCLSHQSTE